MNDLKQFEHGEESTHSACNKRIKKEGGKTRCCYCVPHSHCEFMNKKEECCSHCVFNNGFDYVHDDFCPCHTKEECKNPDCIPCHLKTGAVKEEEGWERAINSIFENYDMHIDAPVVVEKILKEVGSLLKIHTKKAYEEGQKRGFVSGNAWREDFTKEIRLETIKQIKEYIKNDNCIIRELLTSGHWLNQDDIITYLDNLK